MLSELFFSLLVGVHEWKTVWQKKGIVLKPVGQTWAGERLMTVWALMTSGQVLAGLLLSTVSQKTVCWDDSIKDNEPARNFLVITQLVSRAGRVQKEDKRKKGWTETGKMGWGRRNSGFGQGGDGGFKRCLGHRAGTWEPPWAPKF